MDKIQYNNSIRGNAKYDYPTFVKHRTPKIAFRKEFETTQGNAFGHIGKRVDKISQSQGKTPRSIGVADFTQIVEKLSDR